jgi:hypothetical protein
MNSFKMYLWTTAGLIVFVGALAIVMPNTVKSAPGEQGPPDGLNVNVVNTPTVQANQMGTWDVKVNNGMNMPVPVEMKREELVLLREGYTVPPGKRLLIDDMSVRCTIASNFFGDFPQAPPRASAILRLVYPSDTQDYSVGTAESTSVVEQTGDGRPAVSASAGRRMAIFADEGATLVGLCSGLSADFPRSAISAGTGRLIDHP